MSRLTLRPPFPFDLRATCFAHGWRWLEPFTWDGAGGAGRLGHVDRIGGALVRWTVREGKGGELRVVTPARLDAAGRAELRRVVGRCLGLDWDPRPALAVARRNDRRVARQLRRGAGRLLRGGTFWEDFLKTVCTINTNWASTTRMVAGLVELGGGASPGPAEVLSFSEATLRARGRLGYRAPALLDCAASLLERGELDEAGRLTRPSLSRERLLELRGIGPYAADHMRLLQGDYSRVPVDTVAMAVVTERFGIERPGPQQIQDCFAPWGEYRFLGFNAATRGGWGGGPI